MDVCLIETPDEGRIYLAATDPEHAWQIIDSRYPGQLQRDTLTFTMMTDADVPEGAEIQ
jgi:hypothetical protein